jgi:hypothetical protein
MSIFGLVQVRVGSSVSGQQLNLECSLGMPERGDRWFGEKKGLISKVYSVDLGSSKSVQSAAKKRNRVLVYSDAANTARQKEEVGVELSSHTPKKETHHRTCRQN